MTGDQDYNEGAESPRAKRFAEAVAEAEAAAKTAAASDIESLPRLGDLVPTSEVERQADLLDTMRPRAVRKALDEAGSTAAAENREGGGSALTTLRQKAYSAAMSAARPLRDELERILDYIDASADAYRVAADRIAELEAEVERLKSERGSSGGSSGKKKSGSKGN